MKNRLQTERLRPLTVLVDAQLASVAGGEIASTSTSGTPTEATGPRKVSYFDGRLLTAD
jgi:hypothetical protein